MTEGTWAHAEQRVGTRVANKFRLERVLGVGGMGAVYLAVNEATQRRLALKLIHPEVTRDPAGRERIAREATAPNQIDHPGLVDVYDAGTDEDGSVYLCMELLEGRTLREQLAHEAIPLGVALGFVQEALAPLAAAHAKGFVHRDLKPENIFVTSASVKLLDFGLVRHGDASTASMTGTTIGTVHYMSPEQARGSQNATPASDVWSVGVMLYELCAGARPFDGDSALDVLMKSSQEALPSFEAPAALRALVHDCLAKDPSDRPPDAAALAARLQEARDSLGDAASQPVNHAHFAKGLTVALPVDGVGPTAALDSLPAAPVAPTMAMPSTPGEPASDEMVIPGSGGFGLKLVFGGLVVAVIASIGSALFFVGATTYDPTTLVLGLEGVGAELEPRLLEGLDAELQRFGFRTVKVEALGDDPRAALLARASDESAAYVVHLELTNERVRDGLTTDTGFYRQGLTIHLVETGSEEEVATHGLTFGHESLAEVEISQGLVSAWVHGLGPQLLETLYARDDVREAMESATDVEIAGRALDLTNNQSDVDTIRQTREDLTSLCRQMGANLEAANAQSDPRVRCYGDPCGETYLVGITADGGQAIVQVETSQPYVNFLAEMRWAEVEERLERVPLGEDGAGTPTVLATASNFYGVGGMAASPSSRFIAVVEQGRENNLGVVGVDAASGERRVVSVLGPIRGPSLVLPSANGQAVYAASRGHGVIARADGTTRQVSGWGLTGATWLELPALGVPHVLATYHRFHDQILLLQDDGHPAIEPVDLVGRFGGYAGASDGLLVMVLSDASGCFVSRFDPVRGEMVTNQHIDECISQPRLLADGRVIGIADITAEGDTPGDDEVVIADPATGEVRPLTRGTFREANPQVAVGGTRVAFERHMSAPEGAPFRSHRSVVCWLDP